MTATERTGAGIVSGLNLTIRGNEIGVSPGVAIDPLGRVLRVETDASAAVPDLIREVGPEADGVQLYLVAVAAEGGTPVGDGVTLTLAPLHLKRSLIESELLSAKHLRARVACAYFGDEWDNAGPAISDGLAAGIFGSGAPQPEATPPLGELVPLAVLGWNGSEIAFTDVWTARRERTQTAAASYWDGNLETRPWNQYLAQVLQFQDQLGTDPADGDLLSLGFIDLPSAGYIKIDMEKPLAPQIAARFGPAIITRIISMRRDLIGFELRRAQDMRRMSLIHGLTKPAAREVIDILVPNGSVLTASSGDEVRPMFDWVFFRHSSWAQAAETRI